MQHIADICGSVIEQAPAGRNALLEPLYRGDDELRCEVESLLAQER
jgi:hypothetical protein